MAFDTDCIRRIVQKAGVSAAEAESLMQNVFDRGEELKAKGIDNPYAQAAQELGGAMQEQAKQIKLDALRNATVRENLMDQVRQGGGIEKADRTVRSMLHWTPDTPSVDNVQTKWRSFASSWTSARDWEIRKAGAEKAAISGEIDQDVAREMWNINAKNPTRATTNNPARAIAEANVKAIDYAADRLRQAGAPIGDALDYVAHTTHDVDKMRKAAGSYRDSFDDAFQAWYKFEKPLWADKTFEEVTPKAGESVEDARERFGHSVFEALYTGHHLEPPGRAGFPTDESGFVPQSFEGTGNLARKLSQPRVLYYKDADSWLAHMQRFGGQGSISHGVYRTLDASARQLALMEKFGTNPTANFNQILQRIGDEYRNANPDAVVKFDAKTGGLRHVMAQLDGSANRPANAQFARLMASARTYDSISDLGGVGITHFASIWPTGVSEMAQHGVSRFETLGNMIGKLRSGMGDADRQELDTQLGAYAHGLTRDMSARWQAEDGGIPGKLSNVANTFMKWTGLPYVFDNSQAAYRETLSNQLARAAGKNFAQLEPHLAQTLERSGIDANAWELMRQVPNLPAVGGMSYLTPHDVLRIDPLAAEGMLRVSGKIAADASPEVAQAAAQRYIQTLSDRLYGYYGDAADRGVVTSGVRERAMVLGNTQAGSASGEIMRTLAQFKMWPIAAYDQILRRDMYMSLSNADAAWKIGTMMALSTTGGYIRQTINSLATGNGIPDPRDPKVLINSLLLGGGTGILGDFLAGEIMRDKPVGGMAGTVVGPVASDALTLMGIVNDWAHPGRNPDGSLKPRADWEQLARFGVQHIPFANLVYLKGALDYMLWYHLYEAADPGWWQRTNQRLAAQGQKTMQGYAPGQPIPFTPWGLGAGVH